MVNFVFFGLLFFRLFKHCFITVGSKNTVSFCLRFFNMQRIVCNMYCREFEAVIYCLPLRACEIACTAPPFSTMTRDFCVGCVYSDEQASIWPSQTRSDPDNGRNQTAGFVVCRNNFNFRGCCGDWWHETCPQLHTRKRHVTAC